MQYRATINYDFSGHRDSNNEARLHGALKAAGWLYVETTAFIIDTSDIGVVWLGIELVAKQASSIANLSALTYHIQASDNFSATKDSGNPHTDSFCVNSLDEIKNKSFPS